MRLHQQETLYFQDAKSDKVYEVDLCEVNGGKYLVNFRYGRRGKPLREGTKTNQPVDLASAEKIFEKLVAEKKKKGYSGSGIAAPVAATPPPPVDTSVSTDEPEPVTPYKFQLNPARKAAIINSIQEILNKIGNTGGPAKPGSVWGTFKEILRGPAEAKSETPDNDKITSNFPRSNSGRTIERLVWRVGELRIKDAIPLLLNINPAKKDKLLTYNLIWAIGRCGDPRGMSKLEAIRQVLPSNNALYPLIKEAQVALMAKAEQKELIGFIVDTLPDATKSIINNEQKLVKLLVQVGQNGKTARENIGNLYLIAKFNKVVRNALFYFVSQVPFNGGGFFKAFRQLFKAAEFRADAEMFGLMAYRIQKTPGNFNANYWGQDYVNGEYINVNNELKKPDSSIAYSVQTRDYLLRRVARILRKQGQVNDPTYVSMAVGVLQFYRDSDELPLHSETFYSYVRGADNRWNSVEKTLRYTSTSSYLILNQLLYTNSSRYERSKGGQKLLFAEGAVATDAPPTTREEAFPELWDKVPQGFLQLLANSESRLVHEFAIRAARANHRKVLGLINTEFVILLLKKSYPETVKYAVELARFVYQPANPNVALITALINSEVVDARRLGVAWANDNAALFLNNEDFIVSQFFNTHPEITDWLNKALPTHTYTESTSLTLIAKSVAKMLSYDAEASTADRQAILNAGELLIKYFDKPLYTTSFKLINQLLAHPVSEVSVFGGKILLNHQTPPEDIPEDLLLGLINGDTDELREVGIQLLGKLPDEKLLVKRELMVGLCLSPYAKIRKDVQPIIVRLSKDNKDFAQTIVTDLAPWLMKKELHEGRDVDLIQLLNIELKDHLHYLVPDIMLDLLYSARKPAHEVGYEALRLHGDGNKLTIRQIVQMGSNEMHKVREWVWNYYNSSVDRIKSELSEAVRMLDARWEDSRDFTMAYLRDKLEEKDWTPDVLVSICDSVNPLVRQFGKERITTYFNKEHGEQYLLQLSQHPSGDLQHFATNYLNDYAADQPKHIENLERYFTTVLAGVNKAGVAKKRIFTFMHQEGLKDEAAAQTVARVIARQSASMAITDKARCIEIMRDLQNAFPKITLPVTKKVFAEYPITQPQKI